MATTHEQVLELVGQTGIVDGTGCLYTVCEQAIRDGQGTPERVRAIWAETTIEHQRAAAQTLRTTHRGRIRGAYKDLNSRGKGTKCYRMAVHGVSLVWIDQHPECIGDGRRLSTDDFRAAGRKDATYVEVPEGLIVVDIDKVVPGPGVRYSAARTEWDTKQEKMVLDYDAVTHVGIRKEGRSFVHILEIGGVRSEYRSV